MFIIDEQKERASSEHSVRHLTKRRLSPRSRPDSLVGYLAVAFCRNSFLEEAETVSLLSLKSLNDGFPIEKDEMSVSVPSGVLLF